MLRTITSRTAMPSTSSVGPLLFRRSAPALGSKAMMPGGSMMEGHIYADLLPDDHDLKGYHVTGYKYYLKDGKNSKGPWSMYSMRLKECQQFFWKGFYTDPFIIDWGFTNNYKFFLLNPQMYPALHLTMVLLVWSGCMFISEVALCPDNQVIRRQERYHSKPDCFRLHSYAIPYFNHRLRNLVRKYRWTLIQNEPDWADRCHSGVRPDGAQGHHLPWLRSALNHCSYKYYEMDPLSTSCSHINFERIHHDLGYKIQERWLEEDEIVPWFQTGPVYPASEGEGAGEDDE